ncbi:AzlC family ABC transporter permease [Pontibacillus yanchengensis]|uniref:Branched-chain amino acid ABC transporter n=1 Tax=Pontibacillus yanchengensis Y32 TaxID=1385514 RepID=A0A0A2T766_9BACI|nr:AzlC family ABC transporter permease [Pontibacillus yanchengensis]KGP71329.1 branched-chain amino acid ABC transporter [Pontibacillus yanchengensis Y32]
MQTNTVHSVDQNTSAMYFVHRGAFAALPIVFGYLPIGITYGVLAKQAGLSLTEITLMSVFVFAGAAQFVAVSMMNAGALFVEIVLATFVLNLRHFVMSFSIMNRLRSASLKWKIPISLGLTDETFSVASLYPKEGQKKGGMWFYASMILVSYFAWILGSLAGGLLGEVIPDALSQSMGIALYAMFIALLIPSVRNEWRIGLIAVLSMMLNYIAYKITGNQGWSIVLATILAGASGIWLLPQEEVEE